MRVDSRGRITVPKDLRDRLGMSAGTDVVFERVDEAIVVRKGAGAPTRRIGIAYRLRGRGDTPMTTDEIMTLTRTD